MLSPSTEAYDRGEKLAHYKRIPALREVMLVAHDEHRIDLWRRIASGWTQLTFHAGRAVELESLHGIRVPVDDVYFDALATWAAHLTSSFTAGTAADPRSRRTS